LIVENAGLCAGVTVNVHPTDIARVKSGFQLVDASAVRFISPDEAKLLPRYQNEGDWWWLEVTWIKDQNLQMVRALANGALWYCAISSSGKPHVIVLALEDVDRMLAEVGNMVQMPSF
jgi:hypothetical protein